MYEYSNHCLRNLATQELLESKKNGREREQGGRKSDVSVGAAVQAKEKGNCFKDALLRIAACSMQSDIWGSGVSRERWHRRQVPEKFRVNYKREREIEDRKERRRERQREFDD